MKIEKGTPGYLNARKIRLLLLTLLEFGIVIALLVLGYMQTGTKLNLLTVVAIVGCLPACKMLVGLITVLPYRTADQERRLRSRTRHLFLPQLLTWSSPAVKRSCPWRQWSSPGILYAAMPPAGRLCQRRQPGT